MEKNREAAGNRTQVVVGGRSSVVRALAAQASDLGSIPGGFPVLFHIPFSACACSINILLFNDLQVDFLMN